MSHFPFSRSLVSWLSVPLLSVLVGCSSDATEDKSPCSGDACGQTTSELRNVHLSHLGVKYDLSQPVFINNRIPVSFGVTADSVDPASPATQIVAVSFLFVEANPADPANPRSCGSSAAVVELTGDGKEQLVDGFIWPSNDCEELAGAQVNLGVMFDAGADGEEIYDGVDAPTVIFSAENAKADANQACRSALESDAADPGRGCVYQLDLQPTPTDANGALIDVRYLLSSKSSVALVPFTQTENIGPNGPPDLEPSLVVESSFVVNGRDPYISPLTEGEVIPADLIAAEPGIQEDLKFGLSEAALAALGQLPGSATVHYTLRTAADENTTLPLTVNDPESTGAGTRVAEVSVKKVVPGTARTVVHELFIEGETLAAVSAGGVWENETDFVVTGCFDGDFPQQGNQGDAGLADCKDIPIQLVRETSPASAASAITFAKGFGQKLGSDRIGIEASMSTDSKLDRTGASSNNEGSVVLKGKLGKSFELVIAHAEANAKLDVDPTKNFYDVSVDAFGQNLYSDSHSSEPTIVLTDDFSAAKSTNIGGLGFGFGPVKVGFQISAGGEIGLDLEDTLQGLTGEEACGELLNTEDSVPVCGSMSRTATPHFALTGKLFGGINLRLVKAGVEADLKFVNTSFPLTAGLGFGVTDGGQFLVRGDASWDMEIKLIEGDVAIVGSVGIRRWRKRLKVNLFSFSSPTRSMNLMSQSMANFETLD
ncbi:MAG: hypothetical protein H6718_04475 [Polyangiaceae bacterium]|nr:hypothetical protein [Myxococcales bacterium]MCB9584625.1 hypothetical protein [Polyangiaceae bacterium]MCB9609062.1 hypothetical protein [Polyangiaceae bacterium]